MLSSILARASRILAHEVTQLNKCDAGLPSNASSCCSTFFSTGLLTRRFLHPPDKLKVWKPTSPGQRGRITVSRYNLWKGEPFKPLVVCLRKNGGRSGGGRISVRHQGGGHKRSYRCIDFVRPEGITSRIERIEYDPNRSARIALVKHLGQEWDGKADAERYAYVIATNGLGAGDVLRSSADAPVLPGVTKALREMPTGTVIHSIELRAGRGAKMCRSAGTSATLLKNTDEKGRSLILLPSGRAGRAPLRNKWPVYKHRVQGICMQVSSAISAVHPERHSAQLEMDSTPSASLGALAPLGAWEYGRQSPGTCEQRYLSGACRATIGKVGNSLHASRNLGNAGTSRRLGIRPTVRARAMNPCDHPMGGKTKKIRKTPSGKINMGVKTRRAKKPSNKWIQRTRHKARGRG